MNCQRALEILAGLATHRPSFTADEIEELLKLGLAVEADPRDLATLNWLTQMVQDHAGMALNDPLAPAALVKKLGELDEQLKSDWHRFTTGREKIAQQERERLMVRRTLAVLNDPVECARLAKLAAERQQLDDPTYTACEALGSEQYAIARKGTRVGHALELRLARYAAAPLAAFMKAYEKADAKMEAFSGEISTIAGNIGAIRKNPHQVVIGLVKTGAPADQAVQLYHQAVRSTGAPDVAVTCARNAATFGGPDKVAARLREAQTWLQSAGFPLTPVVAGAAKSLLSFDRLDAAAVRFRSLAQQLEAAQLAHGDGVIKGAARLMPAAGMPQELVHRVQLAASQLIGLPDRASLSATAIALASMVQTDDAIAPAVQRFLALRQELIRRRISLASVAAADALECMACPGTPAEVAGTVGALMHKLASGREPRRDDAAIAVAFAKRFAY